MATKITTTTTTTTVAKNFTTTKRRNLMSLDMFDKLKQAVQLLAT